MGKARGIGFGNLTTEGQESTELRGPDRPDLSISKPLWAAVGERHFFGMRRDRDHSWLARGLGTMQETGISRSPLIWGAASVEFRQGGDDGLEIRESKVKWAEAHEKAGLEGRGAWERVSKTQLRAIGTSALGFEYSKMTVEFTHPLS